MQVSLRDKSAIHRGCLSRFFLSLDEENVSHRNVSLLRILSLSCFARTFHTSVALLAKKRFLLLPPSSSDCSGLGLRRHEATRGRHLVPGWLSTTASASATAIQIGQLGALLRLRLLGPGGRLGRRRRRRRHTRLTRGRRKSGFATRRRGWIRGHPGRRRRRRPQLRRVRGHVRVAVHLGVEGSN